MKVLFGLNQDANKSVENGILNTFKNIAQQNFDFHSEYYLAGIRKALDEDNYDVLVLREDLEINQKVTFDYLDEITDRFPELRIILLIENEHQKDNYVKKLFSIGVYNMLYKNDTTFENVAELIGKGRNKFEAKIYLDLDEVENIKEQDILEEIPENELEKIFFNINQAQDNEGLIFIFNELNRQYKTPQLYFLFSLLTEETIDKFKEAKIESFDKLYGKYCERIKGYEKKSEDEAERKINFGIPKISINLPKGKDTHEGKEEKIIYHIPSDYNKILAFVGNRKVGTTTIVDLVAREFATKGKRVAVLDLTSNHTLFYLNCWANEDIGEEEKDSLGFINKGINRPVYVADNYKLFTTFKKVEKLDYFNILEQLRYDNDIVLLDIDFQTSELIGIDFLKYGVNAIYLVQDLNLLTIKETKDYVKDLIRQGISNKKIYLVVNKFIKSRLGISDVLAMFNEPIEGMEYDKQENRIGLNEQITRVDFDIETYKGLLDSYLYAKQSPSLSDCTLEQIEDLCFNIYPIMKTSGNNKGFSLKKLFKK